MEWFADWRRGMLLSVTLRKIAQIGHPVLRQRSQEVSIEALRSEKVQALIDDMIDTMRDANGAGIAAVQVYEPVRICIIEVNNNPRYPYKPPIPLTILVNPVVEILSKETFENYEGCLSVPNLRGVVDRYCEVRVTSLDRHGQADSRIVRGLSAGTYQHEIDHMDGLVFLDRVTNTKSLCTLAEFDKYYKDAFVERITPFIKRMGG